MNAFLSHREKLARLLAELDECRTAGGEQRRLHFDRVAPETRRMLHTLPLVHGMKSPEDAHSALETGLLLSRAELGRPLLDSEEYLGITSHVYTAAGVLYPTRRVALVLSPSIERSASVNATPWDTGSFCRSGTICPHLPLPPKPDRREIFFNTCLPSPEYRDYLVSYVASCFASPHDYLAGKAHIYPDPLRVLHSEKWQSRIFEVRFEKQISLNARTMHAIFLPRYSGGLKYLVLREIAEVLQSEGVEICYYMESYEHLPAKVYDWILNRITGEGRDA